MKEKTHKQNSLNFLVQACRKCSLPWWSAIFWKCRSEENPVLKFRGARVTPAIPKNISLPRWCLEHKLSESLLRLYCQGYVFFIPFNIPYAGHIIHFFVFLFPFILFVCSIHDLSPSGGNLIIGSILLVSFFFNIIKDFSTKHCK